MKKSTIVLLLLIVLSFTGKHAVATDSTQIREKISSVVRELTYGALVTTERVGAKAIPSETYKSFRYLVAEATDNELLLLCAAESAVTRGYAFWALAKRRSSLVKTVIKKRIKDNESLRLLSGCVYQRTTLNRFLLSILTPGEIDNTCLKLSAKELAFYKSLIGKKAG